MIELLNELYIKAQLDPEKMTLQDLQTLRQITPEIEKYMCLYETQEITLEQALISCIFVFCEQLANIKYFVRGLESSE